MNHEKIQEWLIKNYGHEVMNPGLERVKKILTPELSECKNTQIVTIAGTNGKGETSLSLAYMLAKTDVSYVLWTSPHVLSVCERFQSNQGMISESELWSRVQQMHQRVQNLEIKLSYYEFLWAIFVRWALDLNVSVWILEVGLGGRHDAVNMLDANIVLLTSISRDHQEILGKRYDQICLEKLGVMRNHAMLFSALELNYLRQKIQKMAALHNWVWRDFFDFKSSVLESNFSMRNQFLADCAFQEILKKLKKTYEKVILPPAFKARGEKWSFQGHSLTFFGSHNVDGIRKLIHFLDHASYNLTDKSWDRVWVAFSDRDARDLNSMIKMLTNTSWVDRLRFCAFNHPRSWKTKKLRLKDTSAQEISIQPWENELSELLQTNGQRVLVLGSFYFVAEVQSYLAHHFNITQG